MEKIDNCRITDKYIFFWGSVFSNWYFRDFEYEGIKFKNSEQMYMWLKAKHFKDDETAELILQTPHPKKNKALGRQVKNFNDEEWMVNSFSAMVAANYGKFNQNPELKRLLLSTDDLTLVEASPYDKIWGIGLHWEDDACLDENNWKGMNLLGKALMRVRDAIREEERFKE